MTKKHFIVLADCIKQTQGTDAEFSVVKAAEDLFKSIDKHPDHTVPLEIALALCAIKKAVRIHNNRKVKANAH